MAIALIGPGILSVLTLLSRAIFDSTCTVKMQVDTDERFTAAAIGSAQHPKTRVAPLLRGAAIALVPELSSGALHWPLTPAGYGPVRMGLTPQQAQHALGVELKLLPGANGRCQQFAAGPGHDFLLMFEGGRLTRISAYGESPVQTPRGVGIGASEAAVRRLYGSSLEVEEHEYLGLPAKYLTYWLISGQSGVRFVTDQFRRVSEIHAGTSSIRHVEGCA